MLAYKISGLIQAPPGATRVVSIDEPQPGFEPELVLTAPVQGQARLHRTQRGVVVQCEVSTTARLECSRCLELFGYPVRVRFDEEFRLPPERRVPSKDEEEPSFEIGEHHILDLGEAVRQYLTMEIPLAPICQPQCLGLCPVCGEPLAGHTCSEAEGPSNNPFATLADPYAGGREH